MGVGPGNTPAIIDDSADILMAVNSIIHSKTFDNGMICASEQSVIVLDRVYREVKAEFKKRKCYFLNKEEMDKLARDHSDGGGHSQREDRRTAGAGDREAGRN